MNIGDWVQRHEVSEAGKVQPETTGKIHKVESTVNGRAVTNCGQELDKTTEHGRLTAVFQPLPAGDTCATCLAGVRIKPRLEGELEEEAPITPEEAGDPI